MKRWTRATIPLTKVNDAFIKNVFLKDKNYKVLDDGTIWTKRTTNGVGRLPKGVWRLAHRISEHYIVISYTLYINKRRVKKIFRAHRIVFQKYNGQLRPDMVVNHKNGKKSDNRPKNLELISPENNSRHAFKILKQSPIKNAKLSFTSANKIRQLSKKGLSYTVIGKKYNISKGHVSEIVNKKIWVKNV